MASTLNNESGEKAATRSRKAGMLHGSLHTWSGPARWPARDALCCSWVTWH